MVKVCLMASYGYPSSWLVNCHEQGVCRVIKDCQPFLPSAGARPEIIKPVSRNLRLRKSEESWNPLSGFSESDQLVKINSAVKRPLLIDMQDTRPDSMHFSFGIAEQCARQEKILQLITTGSSEGEGALDLSVLSDLTGHQVLTADVQQQPLASPVYESSYYDAEAKPSLLYRSDEFYSQKPIMDFIGDLVRDSKIIVLPDGQVSFLGTGAKMKDLLSIIAEFYLSKHATNLRKQSVVPYFNRPKSRVARANINVSSLKQHKTVEVAPFKSSENAKMKQSPKKSSKKTVKERDLYRKNYFHACESFLSLMIDKKRNGKTAVLSLKKSGPELPELLNQFSASIAGTGIAVILSIVCKVACGRVPFCTSKVLSTGFGFGLVWLSWSVNRLRDTIVSISKNSGKLDLKEEDIIMTVDRSVNEIFFRAATVMGVALLRFARV